MTVATKAAQKLEQQKQLLATAALMEAGRIANNKLADIAVSKLPAPLNMLAGTPVGVLVLANVLQMAAEQFRPGDDLVKRMTNAMVVSAYTGIIQSFNVEDIFNELIGDKSIAKAVAATPTGE